MKKALWNGITQLLLLGTLIVSLLYIYIVSIFKNSDAYTEAIRFSSHEETIVQKIGPKPKPGFWVSGSFSDKGELGNAYYVFTLYGDTNKVVVNCFLTKKKYNWTVDSFFVYTP